MSTQIQNLLTEEMILFMEYLLNDFDTLVKDTRLFDKLLLKIGDYDGSLSSIINNDIFWNNMLIDTMEYGWELLYKKIESYQFTLLEKTRDEIMPYIELSKKENDFDFKIDEDEPDVIIILLDYLINNYWTAQIQEPLKFWAQMEFCGIYPK